MKEITILSGKGGTGKTSIAAAIASVAENSVFCDNDVDASNLHLIFQPQIKEKYTFSGSRLAVIDSNKCNGCGICIENCRFDAIKLDSDGVVTVNQFQCEGCRLCERICPLNAISSEENKNNFWYVSSTRFGNFVHAKMAPGEENSGKLITQVRKRAKEIADKANAQFIINDGPPGIGCSTISSLAGTNLALIVIEPTKSGLYDAERLIRLINSFNISSYALINKYDINTDVADEIEEFLKSKNIQLLAKIPFDKVMVEAMIEGKTILEYCPDCDISEKIRAVWQSIRTYTN